MDFYTQWCGPCKLIKPTLCDWAEEWAGRGVQIFKFEAAKENAAVGRACAIKSVPTFILYRDGEEVSRMTGKDEAKLRKLIVEAAGPLLA
jgi:thioredoxin 1